MSEIFQSEEHHSYSIGDFLDLGDRPVYLERKHKENFIATTDSIKIGRCQQIKTRIIRKDKDARDHLSRSAKNQNNLAKKILPNHKIYLKQLLDEDNFQIIDFGGRELITETVTLIDKWIKQGQEINLTQLKILFGGNNVVSYYRAKAFYHHINEKSLQIVCSGKVEKKLTYLYGTEKYATKLGNSIVSWRVQAR